MDTEDSSVPRWVAAAVSAVLLAVAVHQGSARAQELPAASQLTVEDALAGVLGREEVEGLLAAARRAAEAAVDAESEFDNPEVSYEREQLFGGSEDESEDVVGISKTFEISGGRGLRIEAAEHRRRQIEAAGARWRIDIEQDTRLLFYRALYLQQRVAAYGEWVASLERVGAEVAQRAEAGDVSEYDLLTLTRELAFARAELARELAAAERERLVLSAWIGEDSGVAPRRRLSGELLPPEPPRSGAGLESMVARNPDLAALDAGVEASRAQARAAGRAWVPSLTLSAGYKTAEVEGARAHGFVVGLSAPLPLLSQGRGEHAAAAAEHDALVAERALLESRLAGEVRGRAAAAGRLHDAASKLRSDLRGASGKLPEIAEVAYRGGELGVLELVDAYRGNLDSALRALELDLAAREARIELDRAVGGGE